MGDCNWDMALRSQISKVTYLREDSPYTIREWNARFVGEEPKSLKLAPRVGFEPTALRLTAECSTIELPGNGATRYAIIIYKLFISNRNFLKISWKELLKNQYEKCPKTRH